MDKQTVRAEIQQILENQQDKIAMQRAVQPDKTDEEIAVGIWIVDCLRDLDRDYERRKHDLHVMYGDVLHDIQRDKARREHDQKEQP